MGPLDVVIEADRPLVREKIRQRMSGEVEQVGYQFHGLHKDRSSIDIEIHVGVSAMNGKQVLISIIKDVTERVRAEQKAREQETTFRGLFENGLSSIVMVNTDGTIAYVNQQFAKMLGNVSSEMTGRPILDFIADADRQKVRDATEAMFSGGQSEHQFAVTVRQKGGGTIDTLGQGTLTTFQGKRAIVVVVLDITERRRSEAKIADLNTQMAATLAALQRHLRDQTDIAQLSDLLQSCATTAEAYPIIGASAEVLFLQASGALAQVQTGTRELTRVAAWGTDQTILSEFIVDDCWALRTGQRREVEGPETAAQCRHFSRTPVGPYICLPLTVQGETRGSLHFSFGEGSVIDDDLRQTVQSFGDVVKLSLANLNLRESLGRQALRDQLTGLFNRRYLLETLPREIRRAQRSGSPLTVAMLDIDFFKRFNDMHGHDAGDLVLSDLGRVLRDSLRAEDIPCRYGGEEFLVVLPDCDPATARTRLTQICLLAKGKARVFRGQALPGVTLSVGLATLSETLPNGESLITAADKAMYAAKTGGHDRIEEFRTPISEHELVSATIVPASPIGATRDAAAAESAVQPGA
jgi:diguanylate cyclase (GGDEF)-like protein/PAS domain S-box-containing protein